MESYPLLKEIAYSDPVSRVDIPERPPVENPRVLVVLCSYIPQGLIAPYNSRLFETHSYVRYQHNRLECLKFVLEAYKHVKAGVKFDFVIVDNDSPSVRASEYFKTLNELVLFRENSYLSFGAYKTAWEHFGDSYDYFVFHEMDWTPARKNWLRYLIDIWESDPEIGMIGNLVESRGWTENPETDGQKVNNNFIEKINKDRKFHCNLDSEYLFTSQTVLRQMDKAGWLMFECEPQTKLSPAFNELAFQQPILEMGYKLRCFNDGKHTMFYGIYNRGFSPTWDFGFENLAPFIPEQVRLFMPELREYFGFYDHDKHTSLARDNI